MKLIRKWAIQPTWIKFILVALLVLGVFFRFFNLDKKVYWIDETYTSLRLSGHTETELIQQVFDGQVTSVEELRQYQGPNSERGLADTIKSLAIESPQHPPLYYVMARFWVQLWGYSVAAIRSLSALISLLIFPSVYWLCLELFGSAIVGWVAIALIAVSPFQVLYAQEAREYSLWMVTTALSSAALLRAMRLDYKNKGHRVSSWGIYAASLALGLYTFLFAWFVVFAHGIYVIGTEKFRWSQRCRDYLLALFAAIIAYAPWLVVTIINLPRIHASSSWTSENVRAGSLLRRILMDASALFFDFNISSKTITIPAIFAIAITLYSIYFLCRKASERMRLFLLPLMGVSLFALLLPDLILGGLRSANSRYLIPLYLGIYLTVAYCLVTQLSLFKKYWQQRVWVIIIGLLIFSGILSCAVSSQAALWWNKSPVKHKHNATIAEILHQSDRPLLISDDSTKISDCFACRMLSLSYILEPKVNLQLVVEPNVPQIPDGFSDVFVFSPSGGLLEAIKLKQNYEYQLIFQKGNFWFWKLTR